MVVGPLLPLMLLVLLPVVLIALLLARALGAERTGLHRGALAARWVGLPLGMAVMMLVIILGASGRTPDSGPLAALGPAAGGIVLLLAIAAGELTLPAPQVAVRRASLRRRTLGTLLPRPAAVLAGLALASLALVTLTGLLLAADGTTFAIEVPPTGDDPGHGAAFGPFPGGDYTVTIAAGTAALVLVAVGALVLILRRRPSDDVQDLLLRRRSSTSVAGAVVLAAAACTVPVALAVLRPLVQVRGEFALTPGMEAGTWIAVVGIGLGLLALPVGLAMVMVPELLARSGPRTGASAAIAVEEAAR
ncbi:hypothetical protein V1260_12000 [Brachybacterium sp. J144]|uniref:hypothetical protein n=1 Tax=Brachybacterium sp. J144 TaxID=3116487 RepID=UPI002E7A84D5|nr:hypothetical protein [Brachybacterium sp. J144]MEE1651505.1 hypothetical protein [Brachybacterium sp. J144]